MTNQQFTNSRLALVVAALAASCWSSAFAQAEADTATKPAGSIAGPTVAELRSVYGEHVRSIRTISATFSITDSMFFPRHRSSDATNKRAATDATKRDLSLKPTLQRYEYYRENDKYYLAELTEGDALPVPANIYNGKNFFVVGRPGGARPDADRFLQVFDSTESGIRDRYRPEHLIGAAILQTDVTLAEAMASPSVQLLGKFDGSASNARSRFVLDPVPASRGFNLRLEFDLDARHDYLPARIQLTESIAPGERARFGGWRMEWRIDEFKETADNATGNTRWFPWTATLLQQEGQNAPTFRIERLALNADVPDSVFDPLVRAGTQVMDNTRTGGGRVFAVGNADVVERRISEIADSARAAQSGGTTLGRARITIVISNVVVIGAALAWWVLHRQRSRRKVTA